MKEEDSRVKQPIKEERKRSDAPDDAGDKASQLKAKCQQKFKEDIHKIINLIQANKLKDAVKRLEDIIKEEKFLDLFQFKGWGNNENWDGYYSLGPRLLFNDLVKDEKG
jgi:hypothetical protein